MTVKASDKEILTINEAAKYLRVSKRSIYKLIKNGNLPHKKVFNKFRLVKEDLKRWAQGYKINIDHLIY